MRKLLVALVVLGGVLLVGDRVALAQAEQRIAVELQREGGLTRPPDVTVHGVPFLTQALRGRYGRVDVRATDIPAGRLVARQLDTELRDVRIPLGDVLSGEVDRVLVDEVLATALVPYEGLTGDDRITVSPEGDRLRIRGSVVVLGSTVAADALSTVTVDGDALVVTADGIRVGGVAVEGLGSTGLRDSLDFRVPVEGLPYGLVLDGVDVTAEGIVLRAGATDTVLER